MSQTCAVPSCDRSTDKGSRGWCNAHYNRWRLSGDVQADKPIRVFHEPVPCGTVRGYHRHIRLGEQTCQPCRDANAAARRQHRNDAAVKNPPCHCGRPSHTRGLCSAHYKELLNEYRPPCSVAGCDRVAVAVGMCDAHRRRQVKFGDPMAHVPIVPRSAEVREQRRQEVKRLAEAGLTTVEIAKRVGVHPQTVSSDRRIMNVPPTAAPARRKPRKPATKPKPTKTMTVPAEVFADLYLHASADVQKRVEAAVLESRIDQAVAYYDELSA